MKRLGPWILALAAVLFLLGSVYFWSQR